MCFEHISFFGIHIGIEMQTFTFQIECNRHRYIDVASQIGSELPCSLTRYPQFCWTYLICNDTHLQFRILYIYIQLFHICNSIVICTMRCAQLSLSQFVVKQKHQTVVNALLKYIGNTIFYIFICASIHCFFPIFISIYCFKFYFKM